MKKPRNSKKYAIENTGLTPDTNSKATRKKKPTKEKKVNGSKRYT